MKKTLCLITLILSVFNLTIADGYTCFADNSYWSRNEVADFFYNGIDLHNVLGHEDFKKRISREEFAALIVALYVSSSNIEKMDIPLKENPFSDTSSLDVQLAYSLGITNGKGPASYAPDSYITREEIATMTTRFLDVKGIDTSFSDGLNSFDDAGSISEWAYDSFSYCVQYELMKGFQNKLTPKEDATIEQVLTLLDRIALKNEWFIRSTDFYVNGYLLPKSTDLGISSGFCKTSFGISWSDLSNLEKFRSDILYILNSRIDNLYVFEEFIQNTSIEELQNSNGKKFQLHGDLFIEIVTSDKWLYITVHKECSN